MRNGLMLSGALAALIAAAPAYSQTSSGQTGSGATITPPAASSAAPSSGAGGGFLAMEAQDHMRADTLIGMDVRNPQNEKIGTVQDLVLDPEMKVVGVVVGVGGFLGLGKKDVALSKDQIRVQTQENKPVMMVQLSKEELQQAPEFKTLAEQRADADAERARTQPGTAAGTSTRPMGGGATTPPAKSQ